MVRVTVIILVFDKTGMYSESDSMLSLSVIGPEVGNSVITSK
jgi:hypothetical protein